MTKLLIPREVLTQHVAILGKTRSGKSSVMRLLVEDLLERRQPVCIVDPKGDWYGIKLAADGKRPGYPVVIFGGEHADIPINETTGAQVAELFATGNRPCLIDLGGWMVGPRTRFWIDFASTLFKLTKGERWLAVDEFHNFAPKGKIQDVDAGKMLHWSNRLASEGLGKGLAMLFASQRPQKVHNDSLTSAETLIAMRVLHPSDRGAVSDWIKGCGDSDGSQVLSSLAQMERGEGWVWSPEIGFGPKRVKFPMFQTYDSFRAQTVEDARRLTGWADVNIDDVKAKFAATIEKAKAEDPKELKRTIAERDRTIRELRAVNVQHANAIPVAKEKRVEVPVLKAAQAERFAKALEGLPDRIAVALSPLTTLHDRVHGAVNPVLSGLRELTGLISQAVPTNGHRPAPLPPNVLAAGMRAARSVMPRTAPGPLSQPKRGPASPAGELGKGVEVRMLAALAQFGELRQKRLAMLVGCVLGGSTWRGGMAKLRGSDFVSEAGDLIRLTDSGAAAIGTNYEPLPTDLIPYWRGKLGGGAALRTFDVIVEAYPAAVEPESLAELLGFENGGSTMRGALAKLRGFELIGKELRASEELFG